jgi:hypothetical protein
MDPVVKLAAVALLDIAVMAEVRAVAPVAVEVAAAAVEGAHPTVVHAVLVAVVA